MYLSIDLGSTHFKAGIFDNNLIQQGISRYALTYVQTNGIEVELSIDEIEKGIRYIIREVLSQSNVKADEIKAIGITSQAQTFTIFDENGNPKTNFISWQDKRAVKTSQKMCESAEWSDFAEHSSFGFLYPGLQVCLLKHIQDHNSGFITDNDMVLKLPSYVVKQLTNEYYLDNNLAEMSGLFSLKRNNWWEKALERCGLRRDQLPAIHEIGTIACMTTKNARNYGLIEGIPIILAGNDQTAGAYGALHESNALLITLGTAQVAYQCVSEMPKPSVNITRGTYPYGMFYKMAVDNAGGNVINWAKNAISEIGSYENFFALASEALSGCNGLKFYFNEDLNRGDWIIRRKHKPSDYARSVLEYLCDRMYKLLSNMNVDLNNTSILCAGGGSKQKIWIDILSDKLKTKIQPVNADPILGSAMMSIKNS